MHKPSLPWLDRLMTATGPTQLGTSMADHHPALASLPKRLAILGAADEGRRLATLCGKHGVELVLIADDSAERQGTSFGGHEHKASAHLDRLDREVPIIIASHLTLNAAERLQSQGFTNVSPFAVLQVLHPSLFAPHMFHRGWFDDLYDNRDRYVTLKNRLQDAESHAVLDAVLNYRQTLNPNALASVLRPDQVYMSTEIFKFGDEEVYVDAGAYDGDTIRRFVQLTGSTYARAYGFEPDPVTFRRLQNNFADDSRVSTVNAGLWSRAGKLHFQNDAGRASIFTDKGGSQVNVVPLDEALDNQVATFIKMNIEGAELHALRGAIKTIRKNSPKLAIAAYHRPSDLWEVAQVVDEIAPGYELFLRQHNGGLVETVLYARQATRA